MTKKPMKMFVTMNIAPADYRHDGSCDPSRNIYAVAQGKKLKLAEIREIPKRPKRGRPPVSQGTQLVQKEGKTGSTNSASVQDEFDRLYCSIDSRKIGQWSQKYSRFQPNKNYPFNQALFFNKANEDDPRRKKIASRIFDLMQQSAMGIVKAGQEAEEFKFTPVEIPQDEDDPLYDPDDAVDCLINIALPSVLGSGIVTDLMRRLADMSGQSDLQAEYQALLEDADHE